jgi:lysophospholipase L1-like esterase
MAPAGKVLASMLVCLLVWGLLDARSLKRSADAAPIGARRTAALAVLGPLFFASRYTGLDALGSRLSEALGRNPNQEPGGSISVPPIAAGPPPAPLTQGRRGGHRVQTGQGSFVLPPPVRQPTLKEPERVVVVGDSFALGLGLGVARTLDTPLVHLVQQGRESTGLARPDYFNWIAQVRADVTRFKPDIIVAMFGGNDFQSLVVPGGVPIPRSDVTAWSDLYRQRVADLMHIATSGGARVVWVGLPPSKSPVLPDMAVHRMNDIYESEASLVPGVVYLDSWQLFARNGGYAAYLPIGAGGKMTQARESDGVHFTFAGYAYLGRQVVSLMHSLLGLKS